MILGVHYPTDVLAGWLLGAVVALGVTIAALSSVTDWTSTPRATTGHDWCTSGVSCSPTDGPGAQR